MTITVTPTVQPGNWPPRVQLSVSASAGETSTTVNRLDANGNLIPVRTTDGNPLPISGGAAVAWDYEMAFGTSVQYTSAESPSVISAAVTVSVPQVWLIHPGVPALSMPVNNFRPGTFAKYTRTVSQGVFQVMGRQNPVVVTDGARRGITTSATVLLRTPSEFASLDALVSDAAPLLLNIPVPLGYSMSTSYVMVGNVDYAPVTGLLTEQWIDASLPLTVIDRPAGGTQAQRTWADIIADYPSWNAVVAAYPTWTAELAGP